MAVLGPRLCARAFSSCGKWGPLFIAVRGPLTIAASLVAEHRLQTRRLSNCGSRGQLLRSMWDPPRPGLEPVSPALAGRFSTTAPPGKPLGNFLIRTRWWVFIWKLEGNCLQISGAWCAIFFSPFALQTSAALAFLDSQAVPPLFRESAEPCVGSLPCSVAWKLYLR